MWYSLGKFFKTIFFCMINFRMLLFAVSEANVLGRLTKHQFEVRKICCLLKKNFKCMDTLHNPESPILPQSYSLLSSCLSVSHYFSSMTRLPYSGSPGFVGLHEFNPHTSLDARTSFLLTHPHSTFLSLNHSTTQEEENLK